MNLPGLDFQLGEDIDALRKGADRIAQRVDVFAELKVEAGQIHGVS